MTGRGLGAAAIAAVCVLAASACGDESEPDDDGGTAEADAATLLDYVPPDSAGIRFVDLAAARDELGLPADADASERGAADAELRLAEAAGSIIPYLSLPRPRPIEAGIDHGAVAAAAGTVVQSGPGIAAIATAQPFDDIAQRLITEGYERDGDALESDSSFVQGSYSVIADAGGDVLVLGYRRGAVERAIDAKPGSENPARPLIERVEGVVRGAAVHDDLACIEGIAVGASADLEDGEILLEVDRAAASDRFRLPAAFALPELEIGDPRTRGNTLTAQLGIDPRSGNVTPPTGLADPTLDADEIYAC